MTTSFLDTESRHLSPTRRKPMEKLQQFVLREAIVVFIWSMIAYTMRMVLSYLTSLSLLQSTANDGMCESGYSKDAFGTNVLIGKMYGEFLTTISVFSGWALSILPSKVAKLSYPGFSSAPGFSFASTWILYPIRDRFGSIPNLPTRICETVMGRLSLREMLAILPLYFLVPVFGAYTLQLILSPTLSKHAIHHIVYSEKNPWLVDFTRETFINAVFVVGLLVIPELLKINGMNRGITLLILYPVYSFSVDAVGTASVFGPDIMYALRCVSKHEEVPLTQWPHMLGPIVGAIIGGQIMVTSFPDDPII